MNLKEQNNVKHYFFRFFSLLLPIISFSQQLNKVDFLKMNALVKPNVVSKSISGHVSYQFKVTSATDTIKIDAKNMTFDHVLINNKKVNFKNNGKQLLLFQGYEKGKNTLEFDYNVVPKQTLYYNDKEENLEIWTQGQGKYTSFWLPSFDNVNEKLIFNISVSFDQNYQVISNGVLNKKTNNNTIITWDYRMKKPMSSYLVMLAIGKFESKKFITKSGIPITLQYKPLDYDKFETTYKYSVEIFNFLEKEIGIKYPWKTYSQTPIKDFLYAGMENTTATLFSQDYVVDAVGFNDKNYVNVNAHELAHQWFGNLITAQSGKEHWLQEGFATYYALLSEKAIYGEDHFYYEMFKIANELQENATTDKIPVHNEKASSLSFYKKGAWALFVLDNAIGHETFQKIIKNYLKKYAYKNVTTQDFIAEINKLSNYDTNTFKNNWLETLEFNTKEVITILTQNKAIRQILDIQQMYDIPFLQKKELFINILQTNIFYPIKQEIVAQLENVNYEDKKELLDIVMNSNNVYLRKVIAQTMPVIPIHFTPQYETLLTDKSYDIQEIALQNLCKQFPENQSKYLDLSKKWIGFNNKNLRILWLSIAVTQPNYDPQNQEKFKLELLNYSTSQYESSVRENALQRLLILEPKNKTVLLSLINGIVHHKWQFVKFCKETIRFLLKKEDYKLLFENLKDKLPENELLQLNKLLSEL